MRYFTWMKTVKLCTNCLIKMYMHIHWTFTDENTVKQFYVQQRKPENERTAYRSRDFKIIMSFKIGVLRIFFFLKGCQALTDIIIFSQKEREKKLMLGHHEKKLTNNSPGKVRLRFWEKEHVEVRRPHRTTLDPL